MTKLERAAMNYLLRLEGNETTSEEMDKAIEELKSAAILDAQARSIRNINK